MPRKVKFGTEGWRGVIGENFTFDNVRVVTQAIADYVKSESRGRRIRMIVGYDTRFLSRDFAQESAAVLRANRITTSITDRPTPTPAISLAAKQHKLSGGIMITASHNPARYNGVKFKAPYGGSATSSIVDEIERRLYQKKPKTADYKEEEAAGRINKINIVPEYLRFLRSYVDMKLIKKRRLKVAVDPMYGVTNGYLKNMLSKAGCDACVIHDYPDPSFGKINPEPIESNLKDLMAYTKKGRFDIGIAIDGDGDRVGAAGPDGKVISTHKIFCLLLLHFIENRRQTGSVIKTISGSTLVNRICEKYNLKLHETPVGFKNVCEIMLNENVLVGGEESGGIGFKDYLPERDGMLSGLLLAEMMAYKNMSVAGILKEAEKEYGRFEYARKDTEYPIKKKERLISKLKKRPLKDVAGKKVTEVKKYDGIKHYCDDGSWLLFRFSGTEPILRIYAEAPYMSQAKHMIKFAENFAYNI
jgi:alpha-D-glucose phosphate-specific phosphoglucomutase